MLHLIMELIKKRIYILLLVLVVIVGSVGYWYWHRNSYSRDALKLEILSQDTVDFGQEVEYTVKYTNNSSVRLEDAKLIFQYPSNSIVSDGKPLWQEIPLSDIYPGQENTVSFKARLVGQAGSILTAKASLSYKPKNLNATYESDTSFSTQINQVPINFELDLPSQIESGENFSFNVNYFSEVNFPLSNLQVNVTYPSNFTFSNASPSGLDNNDWTVPTLNLADGGRIKVSGQAQGQAGQQELFDAKIGIWENGEFILLKEITKSVAIAQPALEITQQINGESDYVANPGDQLHYQITFKNVGNDTLTNLSMVDTLNSSMFDLSSIKSSAGKFTPGQNSISWDWNSVPSLQVLQPQQQGTVDFWVNLNKNFNSTSTQGNLAVENDVYIDQAQESFTTKVNSILTLVGNGYYQDEVFGNSGPIPPTVGQTTTYTINWQAKNYYNNVSNVTVKAVLPPNVQLTGKIFPEDSHITYDSQSREIVWAVGDMTAGQGVSTPPPNVSFQVALTPDGSQVGQTPDLVEPAQISGQDTWTGDTVSTTLPALNTSLPNDPSVSGQGAVIF